MEGFVFWILMAVGCLLAAPIAVVVSFSNRRRVDELTEAVRSLNRQVLALQRAQETPAPQQNGPGLVPDVPAARAETIAPAPLRPTPPEAPPAPWPPPSYVPPKPVDGRERQTSIERQFGGRAFVWLGGIALALAGFFLVKYSIDTGLLTENVRVVLGVLFGLALLAGSHAVRTREHIADGTRIAQALAGAGIAVLYGSLFAATSLYHLLPSWLGFSCMAVVTLAALILSLRHGAPIAALGLLGGYATPLMVSGEPNAPLLFAYLYLVFGGLSLLIRRQNWQWLAVPATVVAFAWVGLWIGEGLAFHDGAWLSLFLLGVAVTGVIAERGTPDTTGPHVWLRYLAPTGSLVLMASVTYASHFGAFEWAMFALLSAGAIVLAWFDDETYVFVPWLALVANIAMLLGWQGADPLVLLGVIVAFASLFSASAQYLLSRSQNPVSWAGLCSASLLGYFVLAYDRLNETFQNSMGREADLFWSVAAMAAAGALTVATTRKFVLQSDTRPRQIMQAIFAATATALLSTGFAILLHQEFFPFAIAAEILALAWIATQTDIPALRVIALVLSVIFVLLLTPDILSPLDTLFGGSPLGAEKGTWPLLADILFRLAIPAAMLTGASVFLRKSRDDEFVAALEAAAIALITLACYRLVALTFLGHPGDEDFIVGGIFSDVLALLSLTALWIARTFARPAALWGGIVLGGLVLLRIAFLDLLLKNPMWSHELVGSMVFFNALILAYAIPAGMSILVGRDLARAGKAELAWAAQTAGYVLAFIYLSLNVRQIYAGAYLDTSPISNAEIYTYSAVWLVCGVALLFAAVLRQDMAMRIASLVVMLLTVGKVFLYDASELTGLWRVVSFLGLGLCLLALSWFYSRFVFTPTDAPAAS